MQKILWICLCSILLIGCSADNVEQQAASLAQNTINNNPSTVTNGFVMVLTALGKLNATDAKLASNGLSATAANALASFSGAALPLGSDAQLILNNLGSKLPASASGIALMLAGTVQTFIQIPSASAKVSANTANTVCNLCKEIIAACNQYNASVLPK